MFASLSPITSGNQSPTVSVASSSSSVMSLPELPSRGPARGTSDGGSVDHGFWCHDCTVSYSKKDKLVQHIEAKHPDQCPFPCRLCPARFFNDRRCLVHSSTCVGVADLPASCVPPSRPPVQQVLSTAGGAMVGAPLFPPPPVPLRAPFTRVAPGTSSSSAAPIRPSLSSASAAPTTCAVPPRSRPAPVAVAPAPQGSTSSRPLSSGTAVDSLPEVDGFLDSVYRSKVIITNVRYLLNSAGTILGRPPASLSDAISEQVVDGLVSFMTAQGRKAERIYQLTLLMRRIMEYLAEQQSLSTHQYRSPKEFPAWKKVDQINKISNKKRKYDQRDRMAGLNDSMTSKLMSDDEVIKLKDGTVVVMLELEERHATAGRSGAPTRPLSTEERKWYVSCFITALLLMGFAPRQQALRELTMSTLVPPGTGLNTNPNRYQLRMSAHQFKDGHPVLVNLPEELTVHIDWYKQNILPAGHTGHMFLQRGNEGRQDFSTATEAVTRVMLGREITAHAFRGTVATAFGGAPEEMRRDLARTMNHSYDTHERYYTQQKRLKSQDALQQYLFNRAR